MRRVAMLERRAGSSSRFGSPTTECHSPPIHSSRRDSVHLSTPCPWVETHGYHHPVATRRRTLSGNPPIHRPRKSARRQQATSEKRQQGCTQSKGSRLQTETRVFNPLLSPRTSDENPRGSSLLIGLSLRTAVIVLAFDRLRGRKQKPQTRDDSQIRNQCENCNPARPITIP